MRNGDQVARTRRRGNAVWFGIVAALLLGGLVALVLSLIVPKPSSPNPFLDRGLYVYPHSTAAQAASTAEGSTQAAFTTLAETPAAVWLLPEAHPTTEIASFVDSIEQDATAKSQLPVFVVYGVPSRDCGNFSAGGLTASDYPDWIAEIAAGIGGRATVIILEPDALALAPSCDTETEATGYIRAAAENLASPAVTIYLDGGHSNWLGAEAMAPLLAEAGVADVRGFVTNVSNYNDTAAERVYAETLSGLLGGAHYVIDTSRNGSGSTGEWCNPAARSIGDPPSGVDDGSALDATLWIKNPGESDGNCNGGPPAGQWWADMALELVRVAS
jgi:endoglucanase